MKNDLMNEKQNNNYLATSLIICFGLLSLKNISFYSQQILVYKDIVNFIVIGIVILVELYGLYFCIKRNCIFCVAWSLCIAIFCAIQLLCFPKNFSYIIVTLLQMGIYGYLPFLIFYGILDYKRLQVGLRIVAIILLLYGVAIITVQTISVGQSGYNMGFGATISFTIIVMIHSFFVTRKQVYFLLALIGSIALILVGSRAPILSVLCYIAMYFFQFENQSIKKRITMTIALVFAIAFILLYYERIVEGLRYLFDLVGLESRTLNLLQAGEATNLSGREYIYDISLDIIKQKPFFGIGIEGLRGQGYTDWTPHNLYIELILSFGVILGGIIISTLGWVWMKGVFRCEDSDLQAINLMMFALYVPRSFFGGGLYTNTFFWLLLAGCIKAVSLRQRENRKRSFYAIQRFKNTVPKSKTRN